MPNTNLYPRYVPIPVTNCNSNEFFKMGYKWDSRFNCFSKNVGGIRKSIKPTWNERQGNVYLVQQRKIQINGEVGKADSAVLISWSQL